MSRPKNRTSLLSKYLLMYEKKPRSRVFAPLAETYRKLGMIDEALKILKEGIKLHPTYTLAYVVLAQCYFDMQNYEAAYNTVRPFIASHLENIKMQKLFARTCINLGYLEEALITFKHLLLLNPRDSDVADQIKLLEDDLLVNSEAIELKNEHVSQNDFDDDDWVQVNFNSPKKRSIDEEVDDWKVQDSAQTISLLDKFKDEINQDKIELNEHQLDDQYFHEDYDNQAEDVIDPDFEEESNDNPLITHTLVDLYCNQGHIDKAINVLENILLLHPNDVASQKKMNSLKKQLDVKSPENLLVDPIDDKVEKIKLYFNNFQQLINERARVKHLNQ